VSPLGGGTLFEVGSGLRTDLGVLDEKGDREPGRMRGGRTAPNGCDAVAPHPAGGARERGERQAKRLSERVRHHRENATEPDPNRRG
jgi:hypothetical protein